MKDFHQINLSNRKTKTVYGVSGRKYVFNKSIKNGCVLDLYDGTQVWIPMYKTNSLERDCRNTVECAKEMCGRMDKFLITINEMNGIAVINV